MIWALVALLALSFIVLAAITLIHYGERKDWREERTELLNRIAQPQLVVRRTEPPAEPRELKPDPWSKVGKVLNG